MTLPAMEIERRADGSVLMRNREPLVPYPRVITERLAAGALYPPVRSLSDISRAVALAVAREAVDSGVARMDTREDLETVLDEAMWWPSYVPYIKSRAAVHRDEVYAAHRALSGR